MRQQTSFDFGFTEQLRPEDFIVSSSNEHAYAYITQWPNWSQFAVLLHGPKSCGKTHLAQIWLHKTQAVLLGRQNLYSQDPTEIDSPAGCFIIEQIEQVHDETALLHWFNGLKEQGKYLLMTSSVHPSQLSIRLPDLRSRLLSIPAIGVKQPDEVLLQTLFTKQFADRQLRVSPAVIDFLIARVERSFDSIGYLVDRLDKQALAEQKPLTIPFVKQVMGMIVQEREDGNLSGQ